MRNARVHASMLSRAVGRAGALCAAGVLAFAVAAAAAEPRALTGSQVAWARLMTGHSSWSVHERNDDDLARFIRERSRLNLDPKCHPADVAKLDDMCRYPFIFTNNLSNVKPAHHANVREYLKRGGFIYIDRCVNLSYSLPQEEFYTKHVRLFRELLPDAVLRELPRTHEIFHCHFVVPPHVHAGNRKGHDGIYAVYDHGRMVALLSLASYQCGWPQSHDRGRGQMQMIANIYVYAMTGEPENATPPTASAATVR